MDLGCGGGAGLRGFDGTAVRRHGVDRYSLGLRAIRESMEDVDVVQADCGRLPYRAGVFDVVLAMDLLEHVDDRRTLREAALVLRPGGIAVAACPAGRWLWSARDEAAGHLRRYSKKEVVRLFEGEGLKILRTQHYQFFLFPLVIAARLLGRVTPSVLEREEAPGGWVNVFLGRINRLEVRLGRRIEWPWGSSIIVVGRKP